MAVGAPTAEARITATTSGTTIVITLGGTGYGSGVAVTVVAIASTATTTGWSITDNSSGGPNTWAADVGPVAMGATATYVVYKCRNITHAIAATTGTITITCPTATFRGGEAWSTTGEAATSSLDVSHSAGGTSTTPSSGASSATATADELAMGIILHDLGPSAGNSFTETIGTLTGIASTGSALTHVNANGGSGSSARTVGFFPYYQILSASQTLAVGGTLGHSDRWVALTVSYKSAAQEALPGSITTTVALNNPTGAGNAAVTAPSIGVSTAVNAPAAGVAATVTPSTIAVAVAPNNPVAAGIAAVTATSVSTIIAVNVPKTAVSAVPPSIATVVVLNNPTSTASSTVSPPSIGSTISVSGGLVLTAGTSIFARKGPQDLQSICLASYSGNLYVICAASSWFAMMKSTNGGSSWSEVDAANQPSGSSTFQTTYAAAMNPAWSTSKQVLAYAFDSTHIVVLTFDMATDQWGSFHTGIVATPEDGTNDTPQIGLVVKSNGDAVVQWQAQPNPSPFAERTCIAAMATSGSWSPVYFIDNGLTTDSGSSTPFWSTGLSIDSSDRVYSFFRDYPATNDYCTETTWTAATPPVPTFTTGPNTGTGSDYEISTPLLQVNTALTGITGLANIVTTTAGASPTWSHSSPWSSSFSYGQGLIRLGSINYAFFILPLPALSDLCYASNNGSGWTDPTNLGIVVGPIAFVGPGSVAGSIGLLVEKSSTNITYYELTPGFRTSGDGTATPGSIALAIGINSPAITTDSNITAIAIPVVVALNDPTADGTAGSANGSVTAPSVGVSVALNAPTISGIAAVTAPGIAVSVALQTPTASVSVEATPTTIGITVSLATPTETGTAAVTAPSIGVVASLNNPSGTGDAAFTASTTTVAVVLNTPSETGNATVTASTTGVSVALNNPSITVDKTIAAPTIGVAIGLNAPSETGDANFTAPTIPIVIGANNPSASGAAVSEATPQTINVVAAVNSPTPAGDANVTASTIAVTTALNTPTASVSVEALPPSISTAVALHTPTGTGTAAFTAPTVDVVVSPNDPTTAGNGSASPSTVTVAVALFTPTPADDANVTAGTTAVVIAVNAPTARSLGNLRSVPQTDVVSQTSIRSVTQHAVVLQPQTVRNIPQSAVIQSLVARSVPQAGAAGTTTIQSVPQDFTGAGTFYRSVPQSVIVIGTVRLIPQQALLEGTFARDVPQSALIAAAAPFVVFPLSIVAEGGLTLDVQVPVEELELVLMT